MKRYIAIIFALFLLSCNNKSDNYVNGSFRSIKYDKNSVDTINVTQLQTEIFGYYSIKIVGDYFVIHNECGDGRFITVFDKDFNSLGRFINSGRGNGEYIGLNLTDDVVQENGDSKIWIKTIYKNKLILFNVSESVKNGIAVIDNEIPLSNVLNDANHFSFINDSVVSVVSSNYLVRYNVKRNVTVDKFEYCKLSSDFTLRFGVNKLKKDGTKYANSMLYFNQLNFLSVDGSDNFSVSFLNTPQNYELTEKMNSEFRDEYYYSLWCNNDIVVASYKDGGKISDSCKELHVFDWNGKLLNILIPATNFKEFVIDDRNGDIYLYGVEEQLYKGNINNFLQRRI